MVKIDSVGFVTQESVMNVDVNLSVIPFDYMIL